ncbi:putative PAPS reductase protein [Rhizobium phage RHph_X2_24]|nr:putative PAPS reductase protein [Rhizobium phage RHph_X2_24]
MKYWISTSGGLGSAISCLLAYENGLDFEMIFADTLIEDEDLYRFIWEIALKINKPLIYLRDGRTPWQVFIDRKFIGNSRTAHCSQILKTNMVRDHLDRNAAPGDQLVLGMDLSELDRIERAQHNWTPRPVMSLLNEFKCWRPKWDEILARYGIRKPRLYEYGFPHNNCGGMCVRGGLKQFATLLMYFRDRYLWHEEQQEIAMSAIGPKAKPFLRKTINKQEFYMTMRGFRLLYEAGIIQVDPYDYGGCACFVDE